MPHSKTPWRVEQPDGVPNPFVVSGSREDGTFRLVCQLHHNAPWLSQPDEKELATVEANGELIVNASIAEDVMMRRKWYAVWNETERLWFVRGCDGFLHHDCKARWADHPFKALADADQWYRENVDVRPPEGK